MKTTDRHTTLCTNIAWLTPEGKNNQNFWRNQTDTIVLKHIFTAGSDKVSTTLYMLLYSFNHWQTTPMRFSNFLHLKEKLNYNGYSSSSFKITSKYYTFLKKENNLLEKLSDIPKKSGLSKKKNNPSFHTLLLFSHSLYVRILLAWFLL